MTLCPIAQRRNKWICALKNALTASKIFGPSGDPNAAAAPQQITLVPYETPDGGTGSFNPLPHSDTAVTLGRTDFDFTDRNTAFLPQNMGNIFGAEEESGIRRPTPGTFGSGDSNRVTPQNDANTMRARNVAFPERVVASASTSGRQQTGDIEMQPGRSV